MLRGFCPKLRNAAAVYLLLAVAATAAYCSRRCGGAN